MKYFSKAIFYDDNLLIPPEETDSIPKNDFDQFVDVNEHVEYIELTDDQSIIIIINTDEIINMSESEGELCKEMITASLDMQSLSVLQVYLEENDAKGHFILIN